MKDFWNKIQRKWMKLRLQPIRVYCLHHVCAEFEEGAMNIGDWMQIDEFKSKIMALQQSGVELISLAEAYRHIRKDWIRVKKYAVLTFDDGYASMKEILPWLEEQRIPVTLFINGKYLDGKSYRKTHKERYLTENELFTLTLPLIEIGSHGWEHTDAIKMRTEEFEEYMRKNIDVLSKHMRYIPFHAYTWGRYTKLNDKQLLSMQIIPVLMDGMKNYNDKLSIHRELLK